VAIVSPLYGFLEKREESDDLPACLTDDIDDTSVGDALIEDSDAEVNG
jgi:hypothetical protein